MPKSRVQTTLSCPGCRLPVKEHLLFCHNCGQTMITVPSVRSKQRRPPYFLAAAGLLTLSIAIIMGLTIYDFVHHYGVPGGADVSQRAGRYLSLGQEDSAVNLLEESLQVKGATADSQARDWRLLLDQALYNKAKKLAAEGKFRDAVTAFARISPAFAGHEEVEKLISEYTDKGLPAVFGKAAESDPAVEKEKRPLSKLEKAVMTAVPGGKEHVELVPLLSPGNPVPPGAAGTADAPGAPTQIISPTQPTER